MLCFFCLVKFTLVQPPEPVRTSYFFPPFCLITDKQPDHFCISLILAEILSGRLFDNNNSDQYNVKAA